MSSYGQRVADNILPLSVDQTDLSAALKEWHYTGNCMDHDGPAVDCQMCEKTGLRYHFEIANKQTTYNLMVGSECITRFGVPVLDKDGNPLPAESGARVVSADRAKLVEAARRKRVLAATMAVLLSDDAAHLLPALEKCLAWIQTNQPLTPKMMSLLGWRLNHNRIAHNPSDFRVALRKGKHKADLEGFTDFKKKMLIPYLSSAQRRLIAT